MQDRAQPALANSEKYRSRVEHLRLKNLKKRNFSRKLEKKSSTINASSAKRRHLNRKGLKCTKQPTTHLLTSFSFKVPLFTTLYI